MGNLERQSAGLVVIDKTALSSFLNQCETVEQVVKALDSFIIDTKEFNYTSTVPKMIHSLQHNLNSMSLKLFILVQDPVTERWYPALTGVEFIDNNKVEIFLTEASNINISIQKF